MKTLRTTAADYFQCTYSGRVDGKREEREMCEEYVLGNNP